MSIRSTLILLGISFQAAAGNATEPKNLVWDNWYTVTVYPAGSSQGIPAQYYEERLERKNGRYFIQHRFWKKEEGFINQEELGAFAQEDSDLTPLFFNFHMNYRSTEISVDGTATESAGASRTLTVKIKKGGNASPPLKKSLPKKTIFSAFFPLWLKPKLSASKPGDSHSFQALFEDDLDQNFRVAIGRAKFEKPDAYAAKTRSTRLTVSIDGEPIQWWVDASGAVVKIEKGGSSDSPARSRKSVLTVVERVPRASAEKFLGSPSSRTRQE